MRNHKSFLPVTFKESYLQELVKDCNTLVKLIHSRQHLSLQPYHFVSISHAIQTLLSADIGRYSKVLNGIVCGFKSVQLIGNLAALLNDTSGVHIDVEADFYIFQPIEGAQLKAVVNKISGDHVGCLVHGAFNVSALRSDHTLSGSSTEWLGCQIKVKNEVLLEVISTDFNGRLPYIKGKLISILSKTDSPVLMKKSKKCKNTIQENVKKKRKILKLQNDTIESDSASNVESSNKRKRKIGKSANKSSLMVDVSALTRSPNKKTKQKSIDADLTIVEDDISVINLSASDNSTCSTSYARKRKKHGKSKDSSLVSSGINGFKSDHSEDNGIRDKTPYLDITNATTSECISSRSPLEKKKKRHKSRESSVLSSNDFNSVPNEESGTVSDVSSSSKKHRKRIKLEIKPEPGH